MINGINIGLIVIFVGLYGLTNNRNGVKLLMSLGVIGSGIILLFVSVAYIPGAAPPILGGGETMVDPLPHTFMLTSIVINLATTALGLALVFHLYQEYGTLDIEEMVEEKGDDTR